MGCSASARISARLDGFSLKIPRRADVTDQQALTLLNDPEFLEAARVLAQRLMSSGKAEDRDLINKAYQRVLSREVRDNECKSLISFLATQREYYAAHADEARKLVRTGFAPVAADSTVAPAGEDGGG